MYYKSTWFSIVCKVIYDPARYSIYSVCSLPQPASPLITSVKEPHFKTHIQLFPQFAQTCYMHAVEL